MPKIADNQPMTLHRPPDDDVFRLEVAARLREAMQDEGRGAARKLVDACDVSPQAVSQWKRTGRIDRQHWHKISVTLGVRDEWLFLGKGPKRSRAARPAVDPTPSADVSSADWDDLTPEEKALAAKFVRAMRRQMPDNDNDGGTPPRKSGGPRRRH